MDGVKVALALRQQRVDSAGRGMMVEAAKKCGKDRKEWIALVRM